jgi:hypothetical protein
MSKIVKNKTIYPYTIIGANARMQQHRPGYYCAILVGALLERLKLQINFQRAPVDIV